MRKGRIKNKKEEEEKGRKKVIQTKMDKMVKLMNGNVWIAFKPGTINHLQFPRLIC